VPGSGSVAMNSKSALFQMLNKRAPEGFVPDPMTDLG
jgi:hypothetical protein